MTFIATLIALLIERFFDWSHLRDWRWFLTFSQKISQKLPGKSPYVLLAAMILPVLLAVAMANILLTGWLYSFPKLIFQLAVLLFCLGPQNLWADAFACINSLAHGDQASAADKLRMSFGITEVTDIQKRHHELLRRIFIAANTRIFAVVFWFLVLGPVGAVLYRLSLIAATPLATEEISPDVSQSAEVVQSVLDWVPVRILTFVFALGGEFVRVLDAWRRRVLFGLKSSDAMQIDCGFAALGLDEASTIAEEGSAETQAMSLLDRSFIISLVLIAVIELIL